MKNRKAGTHTVDVKERSFGRSTCFLCARRLGARNRTVEHIFPKWLQERYRLWNQKLTLINGTTILYRSLVVPCCKDCNNRHLSKIEAKMRQAVESGPVAVSRLDSIIPFLWLGKIFYGILYLETMLKADRTGKSQRKIMRKEALKQLWLHHQYLQGTRQNIEFTPSLPASVFVFGTQMPSRVEERFDFMDLHPALSIAMRMGSVGVVVSFQDGGIVKRFHQRLRMSSHFKKPLHPIQFAEMAAKICYKTFLLRSRPVYIIGGSPRGIQIAHLSGGGLSGRIVFDEWNMREYVRVFAMFAKIPFEALYFGDLQQYTFLKNPDGTFPIIHPDAVHPALLHPSAEGG
jgi:hypothetical protein